MNAETRRNHAEYGPILTHMGRLFAEIGLQSGPISAPEDDDWTQNRPSAECIADSFPRGDLYAS